MRILKRKLWLLGVVPVLVLSFALAGAALAATLYSASGTLAQTDPGVSIFTLSSGLPGGFPDGIPGRLTTGQEFEGSIDSSEWSALKKADVGVDHSSFITFADGVLDFAGGVEPIVGVAFGTFDLEKGKGNTVAGGYVASVVGLLTFNPTCSVDPVLGVPASVTVVDTGGIAVASSHGAYKQLGGSIGLEVTASGCLGSESATFELTGIRNG